MTPDMNMDPVPSPISVLASPSTLRLQCSGSSKTFGLTNSVHVPPTPWLAPAWAFSLVSLVALAAFPAAVSATPLGVNTSVNGLHRRQDSSGSSSSDTSISMSVWLPILIVTVVFVFFSFCTCVRRCAANDAAASTTGNRSGPAAANGNAAATTRSRRRPQRTPSQISTKSLPPYMKEPGDQELVLFRGPEEAEDDHEPHHAMPMLPEDDEEHHEMDNGTYDIALGRVESVDTMPDSSTTNLIGRVSVSVPRPPELHHATMSHGHHRSGDGRSLDSVGSEAELLAGHQRVISVDHPDLRGEAPSYSEAVEERMATISLNDPDSSNASTNPVVPPPSHTADAIAGRGHSRFKFLKHNPFSSHNNASTSNGSSNVSPPLSSTRSESPALHTGSTLSRFSSHESHESHNSPAPSRSNNLSGTHTRSNSNLFRAFHSHSLSQGHAGSSTISLDSISAPLTHTATRAEFHIPKGGLLTPEQVKLITSREALEKFGVPYGPDAVAAFSLSRERLARMGPPPEFESVAGEHEGQGSASGNGATEAVVETTAQRSRTLESDTAPSYLTSHQSDVSAESSTDLSYGTAHESDGEDQPSQAQTVQVYASDGADELQTARPLSPRTTH